MKVLITGSNGFIGKNLISHLNEMENIEIFTFDRGDSIEKLNDIIKKIDFIFHLAGVNRPKDNAEFYLGNTKLTEEIINILKENNLKIPILLTSSIQAVLDNDYGKSKKNAEDAVLEYNGNNFVFRLHNVFGKWCKPNYNSVVATFCYNISHDLEIIINDPNKELELIYIDDICYEFVNILNGNKPTKKEGNYCYITPKYNINLDDLAKKIYSFNEHMNSIYVPSTGDEFTKKLFATYVSYIPLEKMRYLAKKNIDDRGSFTELVRTKECGQFSVSTSKPKIIRGNHYHHTKMERFIVVKGKAKISFKSIIDDETIEFIVSDENIEIVTIPVGYTHNIENIGDDEMILFIWCNELFDQNKPDTYFMEIIKK